MLFVDTLKRVEGNCVPLAPALCGALSFRAGVPVSFCVTPLNAAAGGSLTSEIICSTIDFDSWGDLWRIQPVFADLPGVVNRVLRLLEDLDIRVLSKETVTIDTRRHHVLNLVVDASHYRNPIDGTSDDRKRNPQAALRDLENWLIEACIDFLRINPAGLPDVRVTRLGELYNAYRSHHFAAQDQSTPTPIRSTAAISADGPAWNCPTPSSPPCANNAGIQPPAPPAISICAVCPWATPMNGLRACFFLPSTSIPSMSACSTATKPGRWRI